jgi:hypothetical protein
MEGKIRREMVTGLGGELDESWDQIGRRIERRIKVGLGGWAGAEPEDGWAAGGRKVEAKIRASLREWLAADWSTGPSWSSRRRHFQDER